MDQKECASINLTVRPDGWTIPEETAAIHGITTDMAMANGVSEDIVVRLFMDLVANGDRTIVAHNESFDWRIMRIAMLRHGIDRSAVEKVEMAKRLCTMRMADKILKLPPTKKMLAAGFNKSKAPNLTECVRGFFGEEHDKAHTAMGDVRSCARIFFHMMTLEHST
jgi:DNA polymerase-3 subunit epsilon